MNLQDFLSTSIEGSGPPTGKGEETDWLAVDTLELASGLLWIGDPQFSWAETRDEEDDEDAISLPVGSYRLLAKGVDFQGERFVSRIRLLLSGTPNTVTIGEEIAETGTDSGQLGLGDFHALRAAFAVACGDDDEDAFFDMMEDDVTDEVGVLQPDPDGEGRLLYTRSGMGDGGGPVLQLLDSDGNVVGIEHEFIDATEEW